MTRHTQGSAPCLAVGDPNRAGAQQSAFWDRFQSVPWFRLRDFDDVDAAVRSGTADTVVFERLGDFLHLLFDNQISAKEWVARDVRLVMADAPAAGNVEFARAALLAWNETLRRQRRARVVGGTLLSVLALVAGFMLFQGAWTV